MLVLVLICLATYAVMSFRRAIFPAEGSSSTRVVAEAERTARYRDPRFRWIRPAVATLVAWTGIMATLTPVDPSLAVWIGGAVVFLGSMAVIASSPNPVRIGDAAFDRELRDLLDQYS